MDLMQCLMKVVYLKQADFMNTRTKNRSKNRKPVAQCVTTNNNDTSLSC